MQIAFFEKQTFQNWDLERAAAFQGEYNYCVFEHCLFNGCDLSDNEYLDSKFTLCDLSMARLTNTSLRHVEFIDCKMAGVDFGLCNKFSFAVNFTRCHLDYSSFFQKKMNGVKFVQCSLVETDFTEVDLSKASFADCDLSGAAFRRSNLEGADFRRAVNYSIDPEQNRMKKAKFSREGLAGLLEKYKIDVE